jgi:hypothetical protein
MTGPSALPLARATLEPVAKFVGPFQQILAFKQIENRQGCGARQRIARKGSAQAANAGRIHDFGAARNAGQGQSAAQRFCRDQKSGSIP